MKPNKRFSTFLMMMLSLSATGYQVLAQQPTTGSTKVAAPADKAGATDLSTLLARAAKNKRRGFRLMPESGDVNASVPAFSITPLAADASLQVVGNGTLGRLTKWTGFTSSNSVIGDSSIFEDKFGNVSIGTGSSTVTIAGTLQASGGATVVHDSTLTGNGTTAAPLGVASPLALSGAVGSSDSVIKASNTGTGAGLFAESTSGFGVLGQSQNTHGVVGRTRSASGVAAGIQGESTGIAAQGIAGRFLGNVLIQASFAQPGNLAVAGILSKGGGAFKIDHPLDPENKYLLHSFVESPDMMNIYNGNTTTDANGDAVVTLPDYFAALNKDFRYQLTVMGTFAQAIVAEEVTGNRFAIKTNAPNVRVSWQVTGIRHDAFANKNRIQVEELKPEVERGYYLHPDAFDQPEEKSINWVRDPEGLKRLRHRRIEAEQMRVRQPNQP